MPEATMRVPVSPPPAATLDLRGSDALALVRRCDAEAAARYDEAQAAMPAAGDEFAGFRLVRELGRGAFGRVFLALQGDLAERPVALKMSANLHAEAQTLARLQHTNIVPIYSAHRVGPLQAVC